MQDEHNHLQVMITCNYSNKQKDHQKPMKPDLNGEGLEVGVKPVTDMDQEESENTNTMVETTAEGAKVEPKLKG